MPRPYDEIKNETKMSREEYYDLFHDVTYSGTGEMESITISTSNDTLVIHMMDMEGWATCHMNITLGEDLLAAITEHLVELSRRENAAIHKNTTTRI